MISNLFFCFLSSTFFPGGRIRHAFEFRYDGIGDLYCTRYEEEEEKEGRGWNMQVYIEIELMDNTSTSTVLVWHGIIMTRYDNG